MYDVNIPYASPTVLERAALENRETSADWIFPHNLSFYFIIVASKGDLQFNSKLIRKITSSFVVFRHRHVKSNRHSSKSNHLKFFSTPSMCVKNQIRTD